MSQKKKSRKMAPPCRSPVQTRTLEPKAAAVYAVPAKGGHAVYPRHPPYINCSKHDGCSSPREISPDLSSRYLSAEPNQRIASEQSSNTQP